jgi:hypothetical protein
MSETRSSSEYRYTPPGTPGPCTTHPGCLIVRCHRFLCNRPVHQRLRGPDAPAASAHPPAASPNTDDSANSTPTHAAASQPGCGRVH